ncbi:unnamed protein product [Soboliphyme baturini]|uniref:Aamy domain-containing protein n=1 Tax=Soboliphyme baturini TaxID=241478 RepID=A0A183IBM4_9BILA|nr:unnamed protein product [Soboliphyme baturini]
MLNRFHGLVALALLDVILALCSKCNDSPNTEPGRELMVHLFEWKWKDITYECENFLHKYGYGAVQISPPNEHIPVSYKLHSRSGTEQELVDMVERCNKVGIRIVSDTVINHMTGAGSEGHGSGGSYFNAKLGVESFPGVPYNSSDFNDKFCNHDINNYNDPWEVRECRLVSLLDLDQRLPYGHEAISGSEYTGLGRITNFRYGLDLASAIRRSKNFVFFNSFGVGWGYWPSHDVVDQDMYRMAIHFMLAWNYGYPRVMSSYFFDYSDQGPPSTGKPSFNITGPKFNSDGSCNKDSGWVCEHRWPSIRRMSVFHQVTSDQPTLDIVTENNRIAFRLAIHEKSRVTKSKSPNFQRTAILIHKKSVVGQNMFIRGGIDHNRIPGCRDHVIDDPCSIPIKLTTNVTSEFTSYIEWSKGNNYLNWYGPENGQGTYNNLKAQGTPLVWSTNDKKATGYQPLNKYGSHYWLVEMQMDCSKTLDGWFEVKNVLDSNGIVYWENNVYETDCTGTAGGKPPYTSINHLARCGYVNVFSDGSNECRVDFF